MNEIYKIGIRLNHNRFETFNTIKSKATGITWTELYSTINDTELSWFIVKGLSEEDIIMMKLKYNVEVGKL